MSNFYGMFAQNGWERMLASRMSLAHRMGSSTLTARSQLLFGPASGNAFRANGSLHNLWFSKADIPSNLASVYCVFMCTICYFSSLIECRVTPLNSRAFLGSRRHCYPYTFIACRCWARGHLSGHLSKSKQSVLGPLDVASRTAPSLHWARWRGAHAEMVRELVPSLGNSSNMRGDAARH